ncbi:MAG: TatD family hydrolase [Lewinellaceae bacterium]|nr:TatD family hydrolase [Lewinellaceae bacterium]
MVPYLDFHTHRNTFQRNVLEIVSWHPSKPKPQGYYTIGFHPWWTEAPLKENEKQLLLGQYQTDLYCFAIGECGLDKLKGIDLDTQELIFLQHIEIANELHSPIIIHCVRQFDRLLQIRKLYGKTPWVIHGFVRNKLLAKQIIDAGCRVSVAPAQIMNNTFSEMLQFLPLDRMFIETDSDKSTNIQDRYAVFAKLNNLSLEKLKEQMIQNLSSLLDKQKMQEVMVFMGK